MLVLLEHVAANQNIAVLNVEEVEFTNVRSIF